MRDRTLPPLPPPALGRGGGRGFGRSPPAAGKTSLLLCVWWAQQHPAAQAELPSFPTGEQRFLSVYLLSSSSGRPAAWAVVLEAEAGPGALGAW